MTDVITDHADAIGASGRSSFTAPPPDTQDTSRHIGEIFRRLAQAAETFPPQAHARIVTAVLVALGKAVLVEAERQAERLKERTAPSRPGIKVSAGARRVDFDGWDPGDPEAH
ncbi:hypothetical protein MKK58_20030 [Methylobacterium sp. J-078]|jgi:hypothetical protein|uniref:hypothetical protein n=1 Tax=Methylobacterium sp. J-078 TaxID=2836657 RepID=UPI001FB8870E|nr:hypothetical protein [Methylobacterium sp. J-078]MCJ2046807.1 hypothetical protein [Methylobacterium sp. J-078]